MGISTQQIDAVGRFFGRPPGGAKPAGKKFGEASKTDKKCFYCGKEGHFVRDCNLKKKDEAKKGKEEKGKEKPKEKKKGEKEKEKPAKPKKPFKKFVHANAIHFDEEANGFFFNNEDAKPVEQPTEEAEN